jgi:hypothetical protein
MDYGFLDDHPSTLVLISGGEWQKGLFPFTENNAPPPRSSLGKRGRRSHDHSESASSRASSRLARKNHPTSAHTLRPSRYPSLQHYSNVRMMHDTTSIVLPRVWLRSAHFSRGWKDASHLLPTSLQSKRFRLTFCTKVDLRSDGLV